MSAEQSKEPVNSSDIPSVSVDDTPPSISVPTVNTTKDENVVNVDTISNTNNNVATLPPMPTMAPPTTPTTSLSNIMPSLSSADLTLLDNTAGGITTAANIVENNQEKIEQAPLTQEGIPNNKPASKPIGEIEESSSIKTEESQSSSSSSSDGDEDSSSESSDESSSEESSESSEDPSIDKSDKLLNTTNIHNNKEEEEEIPIHMRKSPPESQLSPRLSTTATKKVLQPPQNPFTMSPPLGEISSNGIIGSPNSVQSSKSEELMEGVLTSSQVLYDNEVDYEDEDLEIGSRGLNMEAQQGAAFYAAYTDRKNYTDSLHSNNVRHSSTNGRRQGRRSSKIGQDRASIKSMISHRLKGKGYDRSRRNKVAMRSNDRFTISGRRKSRRASASRTSNQYDERRDNNERRIDERRTGWSNPHKKRRLIYACLACIVGIIGISLIVVGVFKEKEYNDNNADQEYMDNNDFFELDGKEVPTTTNTGTGGMGGTFDIEDGIQIVQPGQAPSGASNTDVVRPTTIVLQPNDTTTPQEDDALLILLKKAYYNALNNISDSYSYIDNAQNIQLDTSTQTKILQPKDQSAQYKAYLHLLNERTDVYDKSTKQIIMNTDRILQIYALVTFYHTFSWPMEGINECLWSGVTCSGLGVHDDKEKYDTDGVPGSAMNEDGIISSEESISHVVSLNVKGSDGTKEGFSQYGPILQGNLPIELMFLRHLEVLDVSHNMIEGSLYGGMIHWKNIKVLALNDNRFVGSIPSDLGYLYNLQKLTLHHNEFDGTVPEELCELRDEGTLHFLWVDCSPMQSTNMPKVSCPIDDCCSICFEGYDKSSGSSLLTSSGLDANKQETSHSVQQDDSSDLKYMLMAASSDEGMSLLDINSPQFHAYAWLAGDVSSSQEATTYSTERVLQRYALGVLYFATNGVNWSMSDGWLTSEDECTWYGISGCQDANTDKIISIELKGNELVGTIPPELFEFIPTLVVLNLATNDLKGPIPKEIGMLSNINILELAENELTSIPSEMGNLNTIDHLFLQSNNFGEQSMPEEVCQMRTAGSLTLLWADCKGNGSLQCGVDCCTTCFESSMNGDNNVFEVEEDTGSSTSTSDTVTHTSAIAHDDSDGDMLAKLKKMAPDGGVSLDDHVSPQYKAYSWLVSSSTSGISSDILLLQRYGLATLYFSTAGHGWTKQEGWLSDNDVCEWEGVNNCIMMAGGSMVTELDLSSNNLVGRIPVELTHVRSLETLDLTDNELYGPIPPEFGYFEDMEVLRLGGNLLTGNIPPELAHLVNLQELYLHVNDFSCTAMPEEICGMRTSLNLHTLWADCQASEFSAVYCDDVTCCTQCFGDESDFIPYGGYTAEGTYPPSITSPALAATIVPGRNYPPTFSPIGAGPLVENPELKTFLLSHMDGFDQRLADTSSHAYEAYMWLANDGSLNQLNEMRKLQRFGLVTFLLSTTPEYDWKVSTNWKTQEHECNWFGISCAVTDTVTELSLPSNRLSGTIPPEIALAGIGGKMNRLNLAGNNLGQELAKQVGFLSHLEELDLRSNDFTGKIPPELGELHLLKSLNLQANEFLGDMPSEICTLRSGQLDDLVADCDTTDPFSQVSCTLNSCCTECY